MSPTVAKIFQSVHFAVHESTWSSLKTMQSCNCGSVQKIKPSRWADDRNGLPPFVRIEISTIFSSVSISKSINASLAPDIWCFMSK